jgi:hypothetical protein
LIPPRSPADRFNIPEKSRSVISDEIFVRALSHGDWHRISLFRGFSLFFREIFPVP